MRPKGRTRADRTFARIQFVDRETGDEKLRRSCSNSNVYNADYINSRFRIFFTIFFFFFLLHIELFRNSKYREKFYESS